MYIDQRIRFKILVEKLKKLQFLQYRRYTRVRELDMHQNHNNTLYHNLAGGIQK